MFEPEPDEPTSSPSPDEGQADGDVPQEEHEALEAIAEAGGGTFRVADSGEELFSAVRTFIQEGLARGNCILDAAFEQANCLEEREPELGAALENEVGPGLVKAPGPTS